MSSSIILVAGSEGSLMQEVIPFLLRCGHTVRGIDNFVGHGRIHQTRAYEFIEGDLCDSTTARQACQDVEVIIQAAACSLPVGGLNRYPADILARNVMLHQNVLWGAVAAGARKVVFLSSVAVYERALSVPSPEEDADNCVVPRTDYGLSKLVSERLCRAFRGQYGLTYTIWRPSNLVMPMESGVAVSQLGTTHVLIELIDRIVLKRQNPLPILGDGEQVRCFIWIEDVALAVARFSLDSRTDNEIFNLGSPEPISIRELALRIHRIAVTKGLLPPMALAFSHAPAFAHDMRTLVPSIAKAKAMLDWMPRVGLDEALNRCIEVALGLRPRGDWRILAHAAAGQP